MKQTITLLFVYIFSYFSLSNYCNFWCFSAITQLSGWMELAKLPLPMYRCISSCTVVASSMFISLYYPIFVNTRAWKSGACGPGKLGRLLSVEIPSPAFTCFSFTSLGMFTATCYGHCFQLYILRFNFAATYSISLPSTLSPPNLQIWRPGHPVHSLFR